jgi:hypothetical protein
MERVPEKPRAVWDYEDYESGVRAILGRRDRRHRAAVALAKECAERYGRTPEMPPLPDMAADDD